MIDPRDTETARALPQAHGQAEVIISKQRHGPIGSVLVHFEPERTRFTDLATTPDYHEAL